MKVRFALLGAASLATALRIGAPLRTTPTTARGFRTSTPTMLEFLLQQLKTPEMVDKANALPARPQKMQASDRHYVLGNKMEGPWPEGHKVFVFANGCFWGSEKGIWRLPGDGIYTTAVGYAAGYWIVRNSWDTDWGNDGYIWVEAGRNVCGIALEATIVTGAMPPSEDDTRPITV